MDLTKSQLAQQNTSKESIQVFTNSKQQSRKNSLNLQSSTGQTSLPCPGRTQGDGMENSPVKNETKKLSDTLIYHPQNLNTSSLAPPLPPPTGAIVKLTPRNMSRKKSVKLLTTLKSKEPKFIPYEPYKAAVNPIIPFEKKKL